MNNNPQLHFWKEQFKYRFIIGIIMLAIGGLCLLLFSCKKAEDVKPVAKATHVITYNYNGGQFQFIDSLKNIHTVSGKGQFSFGYTYNEPSGHIYGLAKITCLSPDKNGYAFMNITNNNILESVEYQFCTNDPKYTGQTITYPITVTY